MCKYMCKCICICICTGSNALQGFSHNLCIGYLSTSFVYSQTTLHHNDSSATQNLYVRQIHQSNSSNQIESLIIPNSFLPLSETYAENSRIPEMSFGTPTEDAMRRDLTINSLFYNIHSESIEDYSSRGVQDLKTGKCCVQLMRPACCVLDVVCVVCWM